MRSRMVTMASYLRRLLNRQEGQSLVELGFLLPFFLVIVIGIVEVTDGMNAYVTITDAARDAARLGSKNLATDPQMKALAVTEGARLRNPIQTSDVTVTHTTVGGVNAVKVRVCDHRTLLLHVALVLPDNFLMCSETTMRVLPTG